MLTVVHLFAGSGGCTLGFQRGGFRSTAGFLVGGDVWVQPEEASAC